MYLDVLKKNLILTVVFSEFFFCCLTLAQTNEVDLKIKIIAPSPAGRDVIFGRNIPKSLWGVPLPDGFSEKGKITFSALQEVPLKVSIDSHGVIQSLKMGSNVVFSKDDLGAEGVGRVDGLEALSLKQGAPSPTKTSLVITYVEGVDYTGRHWKTKILYFEKNALGGWGLITDSGNSKPAQILELHFAENGISELVLKAQEKAQEKSPAPKRVLAPLKEMDCKVIKPDRKCTSPKVEPPVQPARVVSGEAQKAH